MDRVLTINIAKIYLLVFFQAALLVTPVFVPLLQGHGLTMAEILQTQALFALTVAICEVPGGYLADVWGRKQAIVIGSALCAVGFLWLLRSETFIDFLIYEFLLGTGISLNSGADLALLYDSQNRLQKKDGKFAASGNHIARLVSLEGLSAGIAAILTSLLSLWSLDLVLLVQAAVSLAPLAIALTLVEVPREVTVSNHRESVSRIFNTLWGQPLVFWTAAAMIVFTLAALYAFWLYQKYWALQGIPLVWFGYIWAGFCAVRSIAAYYANDLERWLGIRTLLLAVALLPLFGFVGMATAAGWLGVCLGLALPIARGISMVVFYDALNRRVGSEFRATANSLVSLGVRGAFIVTGPLLGYLVDNQGVNDTLILLAILFALAFTAVLVPLLAHIGRESRAEALKGGAA